MHGDKFSMAEESSAIPKNATLAIAITYYLDWGQSYQGNTNKPPLISALHFLPDELLMVYSHTNHRPHF